MPRQAGSHIDSPAQFGARLLASRREAGLRQTDIAFPGCSTGYISLLESGRRTPSLQVVRRLAGLLAVDELWLASGEEPDEAAATLDDADLAFRLGNTDEAESTYVELVAGAQGTVLAGARAGLGRVAFVRGRLREAVSHLEAARELDPEGEDDSVADLLGRAYAELGQLDRAVGLYRHELERAEQRGAEAGTMRFSVLLANALVDRQDFGEAAALLERALATIGEVDAVTAARLYWSQARMHTLQGNARLARRLARRALGLLEATEDRLLLARAHQLLALVELDTGDAPGALATIARGRALLGREEDAQLRVAFALEEARAHALLGAASEAAALATEAAGALEGTDPVSAGRAYAELARAFDLRGESSRAVEVYERAIGLLEQHPTRFLTETLAGYANLLERLERKDEAYDAYKRAAAASTAR